MTRSLTLALAAPLALGLAACADDPATDEDATAMSGETAEVPVDLPQTPVETPTVDTDGVPEEEPESPLADLGEDPAHDPEAQPDM